MKRHCRNCKNVNNEELKQELERMRSFSDGVDEAIYIIDPDTYKILFANKKTKELFGQKIVGQKCYKVFQKSARPCSSCTNKYIFGRNLGKTFTWDHENRNSKRWYRGIYKAIKWPGGKYVKYAIAIDITQQKKVEEALQKTNTWLRGLIQAIPDIVYFKDVQGHNLIVNQAYERLTGLRQEEIVGRTDGQLLPPGLAGQCRKSDKEVLKKRKVLRFEEQVKDIKGERYFDTIKAPLFDDKRNVVGLLGVSRDITERKQVEEVLSESEKRYRSLVETAPDVIYTLSKDGKIMSLNPAFEKLAGWSCSKWVGKSFMPLVHPDDLALAVETFQKTMRGETLTPYELRILSKSGEYLIGEFTSKPLIENGKIVGELGIVRDITEHKKAEQTLRESEDFFRSVVENSHSGIFIIDDKFRIVYANDEAERLGGRSKEEIIGQDFRKFLDKETQTLIQERYMKRQNGGNVPFQYELEIIRKNGEKVDAEVKASLVWWKHGKLCTLVQVLDVTNRKKMETERKHFADHLSALNSYGHSLNKAESMEEIYKLTLDAMDKILGFEFADIFMVEGKTLRLMVHRGYSDDLSLKLRLNGDRGITVKAVNKCESVYVADVRKNKAYVKGGEGIVSELAVPIKVRNKVLGVLNVESNKSAAFNRDDQKLLEILASHAATAIDNLRRQAKLRGLSHNLEYLMESITEIIDVKDMHKRLEIIARAIKEFGWRRVVISLRDEHLEGKELVTAGLSKEDVKLLLERKAPGHVWRERLGPKFEKFKIGEFYYLPWDDPWIRAEVHGVPQGISSEDATTYAGVPSRLSSEEMVDWHPQDMLYAPLHMPEGRVVGILSMDDPSNGRRPTKESLVPLGIFLHQAAIIIENAQLIESLKEARERLGQKVEERTRELRKSQEQLLKAQRLAVIGELAGMVGHDLRNPLTSISGATYYVKKQLPSETGSKVREMLDLVEKNIDYSNKIINDLLDYSREVTLDLTESNPKSIMKEVLALVEVPGNVKIVDLTNHRPVLKADVEKLKRAFVNLVKNAVDAMPKGGTLTIEAKSVNDDVEFAFSDTGMGMPSCVIGKIFTPLFTTKAKGMGFGLAICKRVVEAHGGKIKVDSILEKGTTFTVTLPIEPKKEEGGEEIWVKPPESSLLTTTKT
jgi:PAS domain S-box-containing protein